MKKCSKCKQEKSLSEFHKNKSKKDGVMSACKVCSIENSKRWYEKNKNNPDVCVRVKNYGVKRLALRKALEEIKSDFGCSICKEDDPCCLDFHHIGNKSLTVSDISALKNVTKLWEEIHFCSVVCANCHRKLHAGKFHNFLLKKVKITFDDFLTIVDKKEKECGLIRERNSKFAF